MASEQDVQQKRAAAVAAAGEQFDRMDPTLKGYVTREDVVTMRQTQAAAHNAEVNDHEVDSFIRDFDTTGDGRVTREEFIEKFGTMFD